tara:strand:+ start:91 stop:555 length:465 start_codon:yes stop_codon:yes gene_type:complete
MLPKALRLILKKSGKAGDRVRHFLTKSEDEIEDFVVNDLNRIDKRSIAEIIKEDGVQGVKDLDGYLRSRFIKNLEKSTEQRKKSSGLVPENKLNLKEKEFEKKIKESRERRKNQMESLLKTREKVKKLKERVLGKKPKKMKKGGMVTKWESKWG